MSVSFRSLVGFLVLVFLLFQLGRVSAEPTQDKQALLAFIAQIPHANRFQWNSSVSACTWLGVKCDDSQFFVFSVRLPGAGLVGPIPPNTLGRLSQLRVLSLRSNRLTGSLPPDFANLTLLRSLYLQKNVISGEFPAELTQLKRLVRLDLSSNNFTGAIPSAVNNLTELTGLFLQNNGFSGSLPSIDAKLGDFNVSNNKLNGSIPKTLASFPASAFAGNLDLCGAPLTSCTPLLPPSPSAAPTPTIFPVGKKSKKLSPAAIAGIVLGSILGLALLLLILVCCICKRRKNRSPKLPPAAARSVTAAAAETGTSSSKDDVTGASTEAERNKLIFFEGGDYRFDLEDLLRASAEVLGKGSVGTSYKAVLEEGTTVVVKRLKDVAVSEREFAVIMERLGLVRHDNVVSFRAYYFSKDEKLLVSDFMAGGSLSAFLHGSRGSGRTPLDWGNRLNIALCAARGLAHLHVGGNVVHGNMKSSNIMLRLDNDASISDFGLNPLFGTSTPPNRIVGYRAPEVVETRKVTFKSDVYSFGVLLLELLTGKSPNQASSGDEGIDLPRWALSVVREEWTAEVFDVELMSYQHIEEEMVQLLQIAMSCVATVPDQRPAMQEVVRMIEEIYRAGTDYRSLQSSGDPSKGSDGHTPRQGTVTPTP